MLPVSVVRSSSDMFTIGRIAYRREAVFPIYNALSAGKGGWECRVRSVLSAIAFFYFLLYVV